jgi:hypothetical protein
MIAKLKKSCIAWVIELTGSTMTEQFNVSTACFVGKVLKYNTFANDDSTHTSCLKHNSCIASSKDSISVVLTVQESQVKQTTFRLVVTPLRPDGDIPISEAVKTVLWPLQVVGFLLCKPSLSLAIESPCSRAASSRRQML